METSLYCFIIGIHGSRSGKYLTYKEWKHNTAASNIIDISVVSTLPIRNGNSFHILPPYERNKVSTLPIRNGNILYYPPPISCR